MEDKLGYVYDGFGLVWVGLVLWHYGFMISIFFLLYKISPNEKNFSQKEWLKT